MVTGDYFDLVGIKPLVGRAIGPSDETGTAQVVVVSEEYRRRHLGARADVLGQTLRLNDKLFTIVGVMPERYRGLHFAHRFQLAAPFTVSVSGFPDIGRLSTTIVGRLDSRSKDAPQRAAFDAAVRVCCSNIEVFNPRDEGRASNLPVVQVDDPPYGTGAVDPGGGPGLTVRLTDASRGLTWGRELRARYKSAILAMVAAALSFRLSSARTSRRCCWFGGEWRAREFAIRRSLGASVARVRRQLFIEALEVSVLGGALGLLLAWMITTLLARALPPSAQALGDVIAWRANARVITVTVGITVLCAVIASSLWPLRRAGRDELATSLAGTRASSLEAGPANGYSPLDRFLPRWC